MSSSASRVAVLVDEGYQELEFWYPVLRLREAGIGVTVLAAAADREYLSRLGYPVIADSALDAASVADFSAVILPGGVGDRLAASAAIVAFVKAAAEKGAVLGAFSDASKVLAAAGLLRGKRVAGGPELQKPMLAAGAECTHDAVVTDGKIVTGRAPDDLPAFYQALETLLSPGTP